MKAIKTDKIRKSIRKFKDYSYDLVNAKHSTYNQFLNIFINHCENDEVLGIITSQLKHNRNVHIDNWMEKFNSSGGSMVGSCRYELPIDEEDRLSLIYQLLLKLNSQEYSLINFAINAYGCTKYDEMIWMFNEQMFSKFSRDIEYRLEELEESISNKNEISQDSLLIFNHYDKQIVISNVNNSNIAVEGGNISNISTNEDLKVALEILISEMRKESFSEEALKQLEQIKEMPLESDKLEIANKIKTAYSYEPRIKEKLLSFANGVASSMAATGIIEVIKIIFC